MVGVMSFPGAYWLEHGANSTKVMGSIPGDCTYLKHIVYSVMQCTVSHTLHI